MKKKKNMLDMLILKVGLCGNRKLVLTFFYRNFSFYILGKKEN